jgi:hypothetical protein
MTTRLNQIPRGGSRTNSKSKSPAGSARDIATVSGAPAGRNCVVAR